MDVGAGVAIVGMGCRFPGGILTPQQYWDFMLRKGDGIVEVPGDRWNVDLFYDPDRSAPGRAYTRHGGFVAHSPWDFDAEFFGISPREAETMDPQQRWVLEVAWEALDDAGLAGVVSGGSVGVFVGSFMNDSYVSRQVPSARRAINNFTGTGNSVGMVSNRLSHALDLRGPSISIDTACSSSLVAIHQATRALTAGECEIALAGGVNVMTLPDFFVTLCKGSFLSADGRCKSFDAAADGYGRGEGAGVVVLKSVDAALRDGDRIYAVIAGSGVNQDGHTPGITVPNGIAQRDLARAVCAHAGLSPHEIGYVEAHGTGTAIGDPIEVRALGEAYGLAELRTGPLLVGSVKASIGHLEAGAGIASVIKTALALHHRTIPPQSRLDTLNPAIPFRELNIEVVTSTTPFPSAPGRAVAAVNGFGYGGTNGHVILTEAPNVPQAAPTRPSINLFPLSGASRDAVRDVAAALRSTIAATPAIDGLAAAAWSRRAHQPFRTALPCSTASELTQHLDEVIAGSTMINRATVPTGTKPVFVFSGMGPQWWGMARELLTAQGPFAHTAAELDAAFVDIAGWSILHELTKAEAESRIHHTEYAQPANLLIQVALVAELAAHGVEPAAVVGHSVGEVTAAYVSRALTLADALLVSHHRARLQATTNGTGAMLAVGLPESEVRRHLSGASAEGVVVAAFNGPDSVTLAGPVAAIDDLRGRLESEDIFARRLQVMVAYHSPLMDPILGELAAVLADVAPRTPDRPLYSTVTAGKVTTADWGARYWCDNVRRPVRFSEAIERLVDEGHRVFLEVGPHPVLAASIRGVLTAKAESGVVISSLKRGESDHDRLVGVVGELYQAGCLGSTAPGQRTIAPHAELPGYPWQHKRLLVEPTQTVLKRTGGIDDRPLLGTRSARHQMTWSTELSVATLPWLPDHVVDGMVMLPGAAYLDAFLCAASECTKHSTLAIESVRFLTPLIVDEHEVPAVSVAVEPSTMRLNFTSHDETGLQVVHSTGRIVDAALDAPQPGTQCFDDGDRLSHAEFYALLESRGLQYGPMFRRVTEATVSPDGIVAMIDPGLFGSGSKHLAHPVVVDAALHSVAALDDVPAGTMVPVAVESVRLYGPTTTGPVTALIRRRKGPNIHVDITLSGPDGIAFLELVGVRFANLVPTPSPLTQLDSWFYEIDWRPVDLTGTRGRLDRPVLTVGVGNQSGDPLRGVQLPTSPDVAALATHSNPMRRWVHRRDRAANVVMPPVDLARAIRRLGGADVTVLVVAGTSDQVGLIDELVEVARQFDVAIDSDPDVKIDAVLLTAGAFWLPGDRGDPNVLHAALTGARRVLQNEQSTVRWRHIDLEPGNNGSGFDVTLLNEIRNGRHLVDEIAVRGRQPLAPYLRRGLADRLEPYTRATSHADPEASFVLDPPTTRLLDDVVLRAAPRSEPGPGQVEVRIDAIGLNYKDSMKLLGVLTPQNLQETYFGTSAGMEGVGVVTRAGRGTRFGVGDRVLVSVPNMFSRYLTFDPSDVVLERLTHDVKPEVAGSFIPYMTAHYGLVHAARLRDGETILIHGAAGGTGAAAVKVARHLGARVIASAGTEARREFARAAGAHHTVNSRAVNFVDDVMRLTDGRGADVIYTSLPGEALRQNLKAAAEFGRIVDIGKADIYSNGTIELGAFDHNLQYIALDVDRMFAFRRKFAVGLAAEVIARIDDGTYPTLPTIVYDVDQLPDALGVVARGTQQGRVVVTLDGIPPVRPPIPAFTVRAEATYLVTGAFGAVGLAMVDWLVAQGARHLIVVSRSGASGGHAKRRLDAWRAAGAKIHEEAVDVGDALAISRLINTAMEQMPPLKGVFHAAGVSEDSAYHKATAEALRRTITPKLGGGWNLHNAIEQAGCDVEAFVLFSSVSALAGLPLQVGYAAANAGLDALAQLRRAHGKAGLSVNWGRLRGGGMADSTPEARRLLGFLGRREISMGHVPPLLAAALGFADEVPNAMVANVDWSGFLAAGLPSKYSTRFGEFVLADDGGGGGIAFRAELFALPDDQRLEVLTTKLSEQVAAVMGIAAEAIDHHSALPDLGLDSLSQVELSSRVAATLDIRIPAVDFGRLPGLSAIAKQALAGVEAS